MKFLLKIYEDSDRKRLITTISSESFKEIKRLKRIANEDYPEKEIVLKEKTKNGYIEI